MKKKHAYYQGRQYDPKNPRDARRITDDPRQANGPLVHRPGSDNRRYIGWSRVRQEEPVLDDDGDTIPVEEFEEDKHGAKRHVFAPLQFRWVYDPTPFKIAVSFQNMKAIHELNRHVEDGDLVILEPDAGEALIKARENPTPKKKKPKD